ncbi:hypothetical protein [Lactobacillus crispatus]|uniref:hypothetical protein n=1 Tax=Lactobacillus crispatus TaxID=47770 RepID=UPI001238AC85|nr:hypothetical protein [Lactobacillus crispatus]KAA8807779.1 hypothetical protein F1C08_10150 [Lactobacillus crispatus]
MLHLTEAINWPTFVLSIVSSGGILGLFGFILHLKEYYSKKPKIICKKDDIYDSYWEHGDKVNLDGYDKYIAESIKKQDLIVLTVKVINTRSTPLTLEGFYYVDEEDKNEYHAYSNIKLRDELYETAFLEADTGEKVYIPLMTPDTSIKFPYRLDGFDIVKVCIAFTVSRNDEDCRSYNVILRTPFKDFKYIFEVQSIHERLIHKKIGMIAAGIFEKELHNKK